MMKFTSHPTAIDMVLSISPRKQIDWSAYVRCECKHGTRPPSLNNTRKFFMIFTFKITRIHSNLWCHGQLTVFSPAGQWRHFPLQFYDLQRSWSSSLPPPRCARIENNKCVLWRLIKLCDRETHIHILPTFWGLSPNFTTWYISTFWVDWDRIFPRTRKKSSGEIYVLGVKVFLYTRVLGASVKPTQTK